MWENNRTPRTRPPHRVSQAGGFIIEFAFVILAFFTFIFCMIEVARAMYLWNTLQEVTRRGASEAAATNFSDMPALNLVRQHAIFRDSPGMLRVGNPVTDAHIRIDYLSLARASDGRMTLAPIPTLALPSCPARNQVVCTADPNSPSCIRFVRVRICEPGGDANVCNQVSYVPVVPIITVSSLKLPPSTTIVKAETLGYEPGQSLCP